MLTLGNAVTTFLKIVASIGSVQEVVKVSVLDASAAFLEGLLLCTGLFNLAGPKDTFVIGRSTTSRHLLLMSVTCAASDALLIVLGAYGLGAVLIGSPRMAAVAFDGAVCYLAYHGLVALRTAIRPDSTGFVQGTL